VTVVISLAIFAFVLSDDASGGPEPAESVAILADTHAAIFIWNLNTLIVFRCEGLFSTPGGTRTPNLLIRRSPSGVHWRPHSLEQKASMSMGVHTCPQPSTAIGSQIGSQSK
jgi:hypothetical protein